MRRQNAGPSLDAKPATEISWVSRHNRAGADAGESRTDRRPGLVRNPDFGFRTRRLIHISRPCCRGRVNRRRVDASVRGKSPAKQESGGYRKATMPEFNHLSDKLRHTRRNFLKIGAIGASAAAAVLHRSRRAEAQCRPGSELCFCFLKGMRVRTVEGDREVQDLRIGDRIPTVFGGMRPIKAISSHSYKKRDLSQPWDRSVLPVRIAQSALAP